MAYNLKELLTMPGFRRIVFVTGLLLSASTWGTEFNVRFVDNDKGEFAAQGWMTPDSAFQRNVQAALRL